MVVKDRFRWHSHLIKILADDPLGISVGMGVLVGAVAAVGAVVDLDAGLLVDTALASKMQQAGDMAIKTAQVRSIAPARSTAPTSTAAQAVDNAVRALRSGNQRAARQWARQAVSIDPQAVEAWLILAQISGSRARVAYLEQAVKARPDNPAALEALRLARLNREAGDSESGDRGKSVQGAKKLAVTRRPAARSAGWTLTLISLVYLFTALVTAALLWLAFPHGILKAQGASLPESAGTAAPAGTATVITETTVAATPLAAELPDATATPFLAYTNTPTPQPPTATASPTAPPTETPVAIHRPDGLAEAGGKLIVVNITEQRVYAFDGDQLVFDFAASTGHDNLTLPGSFQILDKIPNAYSNPWGFWMPYWMGIYWVGSNLENGFHSLPVLASGEEIWGDAIGTPVTYGCVVLRPEDMQQLFEWAEIGTPVEIIR